MSQLESTVDPAIGRTLPGAYRSKEGIPNRWRWRRLLGRIPLSIRCQPPPLASCGIAHGENLPPSPCPERVPPTGLRFGC